MVKRLLLGIFCLLYFTATGFAHEHHRHHHRHSGRYSEHQARGERHFSRHRRGDFSSTGITHVRLDDGQTIAVASAYASRFAGFFHALYHREGHLPEIKCLASGHMAHSLHHWGGACDVGQTARNVAWRAMYHVGALASEYGLTDGCNWSHPDCGHVDVSGVGGGHRYASRHYRHYARHHYRHYARG